MWVLLPLLWCRLGKCGGMEALASTPLARLGDKHKVQFLKSGQVSDFRNWECENQSWYRIVVQSTIGIKERKEGKLPCAVISFYTCQVSWQEVNQPECTLLSQGASMRPTEAVTVNSGGRLIEVPIGLQSPLTTPTPWLSKEETGVKKNKMVWARVSPECAQPHHIPFSLLPCPPISVWTKQGVETVVCRKRWVSGHISMVLSCLPHSDKGTS